jgi:hypothetical protein
MNLFSTPASIHPIQTNKKEKKEKDVRNNFYLKKEKQQKS